MQFEQFAESPGSEPPENLSLALQALWYDYRGDWTHAHDLINHEEDRDCAWVHAYLHRKEGDEGNASYWYRRAGRKKSAKSLASEREEITRSLLALLD